MPQKVLEMIAQLKSLWRAEFVGGHAAIGQLPACLTSTECPRDPMLSGHAFSGLMGRLLHL